MFQPPIRSDVSDHLIHLTGDRSGISSKEALISILAELGLRGSGNDGFVKGSRRAACFTETQDALIPEVIRYRRSGDRPYGPYGIMLSKVDAWNRGTRPVMYLPDQEGLWVPMDERWRHVRFEYGFVDFTHEREWRAPGDFFSLRGISFSVIVPGEYQAQEIYNEIRSLEDEQDILEQIRGFHFVCESMNRGDL